MLDCYTNNYETSRKPLVQEDEGKKKNRKKKIANRKDHFIPNLLIALNKTKSSLSPLLLTLANEVTFDY